MIFTYTTFGGTVVYVAPLDGGSDGRAVIPVLEQEKSGSTLRAFVLSQDRVLFAVVDSLSVFRTEVLSRDPIDRHVRP